jgi:hypothetical protein
MMSPIPTNRAGVIRPDLIPLAAFLCVEEYDAVSRGIILDHAAAGAPLRNLTIPAPGTDGWRVLEPHDLAGALEALARGGPAPAAVGPVEAIPAPIAGGAPTVAECDPRPRTAHAPASLPELVDHEALAYRAWGTPEGDFLARQMERLAQLVRWTGANTPEEHEARMEVWDDEVRDQWFDRGYQEGLEAGRREAARMAREDRY